jgi:hypothetical protein
MYSQRCVICFSSAWRPPGGRGVIGQQVTVEHEEDHSCTASSTVNNCLRGVAENLSVTATALLVL